MISLLFQGKQKLRRAERDLAKVQKDLDPSELPTDSEIITEEERLLYRKIGLSMDPFLLLGKHKDCSHSCVTFKAKTICKKNSISCS